MCLLLAGYLSRAVSLSLSGLAARVRSSWQRRASTASPSTALALRCVSPQKTVLSKVLHQATDISLPLETSQDSSTSSQYYGSLTSVFDLQQLRLAHTWYRLDASSTQSMIFDSLNSKMTLRTARAAVAKRLLL